MKALLEAAALAIIAVFAPVRAAMIAALSLIAVDLVVGILAARKRGTPITSAGIKRTVGKVVLYQVAIMTAHIVQTYLTGDVMPASKMVAALIGIVELKSIMENLDTLNGTPLFNAIVQKLVQSSTDVNKHE